MRWLWLAVAVALGCGGGPAPRPVEREVSPPRQPIDVVGDLMRGANPRSDAVDPARGVVFAEYYTDPSEQDPRAGEDGLVRVAARLCGAELAARLERFRGELSRHTETTVCAETYCTYQAAGEYDLDARLEFAPGPVLESVVLIEGGPVTEEFTTEARDWARRELARLAKGSCR